MRSPLSMEKFDDVPLCGLDCLVDRLGCARALQPQLEAHHEVDPTFTVGGDRVQGGEAVLVTRSVGSGVLRFQDR